MATATAAEDLELPEEIVTDILVRLPVKSLTRFRCVCKPWRSLINNPYFIRMHLNFTTNVYNNNTEENEYESAVLYAPSITKFNATTINTINYNSTAFKYLEINNKKEGDEDEGNHNKITPSVEELVCPPELWSSPCGIRACCDGILCIKSRDSIFLWNPSINVYKKLAPFRDKFPCQDVFGIGYDPSVDDYKVFRAPARVEDGMTNSHSSVQVLALKSNTWKTVVLDELPYKIICGGHPTFTYGGIHWLAIPAGTRRGAMIVYFDVVGEKLGEVPLPPRGGSGSFRGLQLLRGKLSVLHYEHESQFQLWVMQEYGVKESWIKLMTVPKFPRFLYSGRGSVRATPFCLTRIGVVLSIKGEYLMYNTKDESFEKIFISGLGNSFHKIPYVGSLVSPLADWNPHQTHINWEEDQQGSISPVLLQKELPIFRMQWKALEVHWVRCAF